MLADNPAPVTVDVTPVSRNVAQRTAPVDYGEHQLDPLSEEVNPIESDSRVYRTTAAPATLGDYATKRKAIEARCKVNPNVHMEWNIDNLLRPPELTSRSVTGEVIKDSNGNDIKTRPYEVRPVSDSFVRSLMARIVHNPFASKKPLLVLIVGD